MEENSLTQRLRGRAAYLRDNGEVKSPDLMEDAADEIDRLRELCREAYHELNCGEEGDIFDRTHRCGRCDESIDRNGALRGRLAIAFVLVPNA